MPALLFLPVSPGCLVCRRFVAGLVGLPLKLWQKIAARAVPPLNVVRGLWGTCESVQMCGAVPGWAAGGAGLVLAPLGLTGAPLSREPSWS